MRRGGAVLAAIGAANALVACMHFGLAAAGPQLRSGLSLDAGALGVLLSAIPAGLMIGTFAWGELADRIGERRALLAAYAGVVVAFALAAAIAVEAWEHDPSGAQVLALGVALLVTGTAGSAAHSAGGRAITEAFPAHVHARVLAIRHTLIPVGGTIGGVLVPWGLHAFGLAEVLVAGAFAAVAVIVGIARALPAEGPPASVDPARAAVDAAFDGELARSDVVDARSASPLRRPPLWVLGVSCSMLALVQLALVSFLTLHLVDIGGLGIAAAATIFSVVQLTGAVGRIALGAVSDRSGDPAVVLGSVSAAGGLLLLAALVAPARIEGALLALTLLVATTWNGVAVAAAARLAPAGRTGATLGMQTTMFATMGVVAPIVAGVVIDRAGWTPLLIAGVAALTAATVGMALLRPQLRRVDASRATCR